MFTAIYVYTSASVTISTAETGLLFECFDGPAPKLKIGVPLDLSEGIYVVESNDPLQVTYAPSPAIEIVTTQLKDDIPPPRPGLQKVPSGSSDSTFEAAFQSYRRRLKGAA